MMQRVGMNLGYFSCLATPFGPRLDAVHPIEEVPWLISQT
jgi:hypothetical protein